MQIDAGRQTTPHVLVAVPTMGAVHPQLTALMLEWARAYPPEQLSFFMTQRVYPHDRARNRIVRHVLESAASHVLMIDSDMIPPRDAIERLLAHGKPFVTGLTPLIKMDSTGKTRVIDFAFARTRPGETELAGEAALTVVSRNSGLVEIERCGAGCLLLHRSLLQAMQPPWFAFTLNADGTEIATSEDVGFCDRLRAAGVALYADTSVICRHEKSTLL